MYLFQLFNISLQPASLNVFQVLLEVQERKLSKLFHIIERNEASEAAYLDRLEIHREIQPHEIQKIICY